MAPPKSPKRSSGKKVTPARKSRGKPQVLTPEVLGREEEEEADDGQESTSETEESDRDVDVPEVDPESDASAQVPATLDSELRAVSPSDPLKHYMEELRRYPLLEPEEELSLAIRLREKGDVDAAKRLVQANLRLVVKIAFEYRSVYANIMDLIQEGNVGLMKAVSRFDPTKGARLGYYSSWWIRSYILKYLLDNFRLVKIGTTAAQKKLFFHLMREKERLEAQGILAAPKLIAQKLDVKEKDVIEMEKRLGQSGSEVSLDSPVQPGEGRGTFVELLQDHQEGADERIAREELIEILKEKLPEFTRLLNDKERKLLQERLLAEEPKTLQEVADQYGLTRERARQIEAKVLEKLREFLREELK